MNSYHDTKEYQQTFYIMDKTLKYIHENNYQVYSFNPEEIVLYKEQDKMLGVDYQNIIDNIGIKRLREIIMNGKINLVTNADLLLSSPKF